MKKESEKELKQTRLVIILLAFIILLVFIVGVLIGERRNKNTKTYEQTKVVDKKEEEPDNTKKPEETDNTEKPEEKEEKTENKYDEKELVKKAKAIIPYELCGGTPIPLNKKDLALKDLTDNLKGQMVLNTVGAIMADEVTYINPDDYAKYFEDLSFLYKLKNNTDLQYSLGAKILSYKNNKYVVEGIATGCEGAYEGADIKYIDYEVKEHELKLIYAYYWITYDYEGEFSTYYKEKNGKVIYDKVTIDENSSDYRPIYKGKELSYEEFNKYEFIFDITNGNIRFEKMSYNEAK